MSPARKAEAILAPYKKADLHVRTTASMGLVAPYEAVEQARKKGLTAIAIADHDSIEAIPIAKLAGEIYDVEVIPAVETTCMEGNNEIHLIGYFIDWKNRTLTEILEMTEAWRGAQIEQILEKLKGIGISISFDEVLKEAGEMSVLSRTHVAKKLVEKGCAKNTAEAFEKYLGPGCPAYVPRSQLALDETAKILKEAGGVLALAHPKFCASLKILPKLIKLGLSAIEVYHPAHSKEEIQTYQRLAKKYKLIEVGGSDISRDHAAVGGITVPYSVVEKLKQKLKR